VLLYWLPLQLHPENQGMRLLQLLLPLPSLLRLDPGRLCRLHTSTEEGKPTSRHVSMQTFEQTLQEHLTTCLGGSSKVHATVQSAFPMLAVQHMCAWLYTVVAI
jgi:hypothetical protein